MKSLRDKIESIISILNLSPMKFADEINVSRPIVSHILKGRNKPSLEIVQKIYERFPSLGVEWAMDGKDLDEVLVENIRLNSTFSETRELNESSNIPGVDQILNSQEELKEDKKVVKVILFYSDGTFRSFNSDEISF